MTEKLVFVLGDKLPTCYEATIATYSVATQPKGAKMKKTIHAYAMSLINIWVKAFGQSHVMSRNAITKKLQKLGDSYWNDVYSKAHRKKGKGKTKDVSTFMSIRHFNKNWRTKALNKTGLSNGSLLDIGSKMESLTSAEKIFYEDQKSEKECRIRDRLQV